MLRFLITKAWPALIPLAIYVLWMALRRRKAKKQADDIPSWIDGPWAWAVGASLLLLIGGLIWVGVNAPSNKDVSYQPKTLIDGQLVDETLQ